MIGQNLKYHRMLQGLTQRDVAMCSGLSYGCIGTIETRNKDISLCTAIRLAKALDISLDDLCKDITREEWQKAVKAKNNRLQAKKELRKKRQAINKKRFTERRKLNESRI